MSTAYKARVQNSPLSSGYPEDEETSILSRIRNILKANAQDNEALRPKGRGFH